MADVAETKNVLDAPEKGKKEVELDTAIQNEGKIETHDGSGDATNFKQKNDEAAMERKPVVALNGSGDGVQVNQENGEDLAMEVKSNPDKEVNAESVKQDSDTITALEERIIRQVEYYFGDINLLRDKFLQEQIKLDSGWIPLETMLKFNRLSQLTTDKVVIVTALAKSKTQLMETSDDASKIRRRPSKPLPESSEKLRQEMTKRTVYIKGFPLDSKLDPILDFLNNFGTIDNVNMRHYQDKAEKRWIFKGSVFAVFQKIEEADKFLKQETVKFGDIELIKMWQQIYIDKKRSERLDAKVEKKKLKGNYVEKKPNVEEEKRAENELAKGTVLHLSKCPTDLTRESIKDRVETLGVVVAFVDFNKGDEEGWVRLQEEGTAAEVVKALSDGRLSVEGSDVEVRAVEGDEEAQFLEKAKGDMAKRRSQQAQRNRRGGRRGGNRGRGGGGHWGKRKASSGHEDGATPAKVKAE